MFAFELAALARMAFVDFKAVAKVLRSMIYRRIFCFLLSAGKLFDSGLNTHGCEHDTALDWRGL